MQPAPQTMLDLDRLALSHGEGRRLELPIRLGAVDLGGQTYRPVPEAGEVSLSVSRTASGHAFHLAFSVRLEGPCVRCLRDASVELSVDAREVDQPSTDDEELTSPYVEEGILDVGSLGPRRADPRDAGADPLPRGLPRPLRGLRGAPRGRGAGGARPRGGRRSPLGEAGRIEVPEGESG